MSDVFVFMTTGGTVTYGELYAGSISPQTLVAADYNKSGLGDNLFFTCDLTSGTTYYLKVWGDAGGSYELKINKIQYKAIVENRYDKGYTVRIFGADTLGAGGTREQTESKIDDYMDKVAIAYLGLFGLDISWSGATYFNSRIDQFKGGNVISCSAPGVIHPTYCGNSSCDPDKKSKCPHNCPNAASTGCNINRVSPYDPISTHQDFNLPLPSGSKTKSIVYWTGHKLRNIPVAGEFNRSIVPPYPVGTGYHVYLMDLDGGSTSTLFHELAHTYGVKDHYHEYISWPVDSCWNKARCSGVKDIYGVYQDCPDKPSNYDKRDPHCTMQDSAMDIWDENIFCSKCTIDILAHLNGHHKK